MLVKDSFVAPSYFGSHKLDVVIPSEVDCTQGLQNSHYTELY